MAIGLIVRDPSTGAIVSEVTTRLSRVLGTLFVGAGAVGSVTDAGFATGTPYCIAVRTSAGTPTQPNASMAPPIISFVGTTMNYDVASPSNDHLLIYGVY